MRQFVCFYRAAETGKRWHYTPRSVYYKMRTRMHNRTGDPSAALIPPGKQSTTHKEIIMEDLKMKIREIKERQDAIEGYL